jgi:calcineurin-like phosphoesterase family protein
MKDKSKSRKLFTSDLHVSHKRIVEFTQRGLFTTQENHDDWLTRLWNREVNPGDFVYHLGDFSFAKRKEDILAFVQKLNGQKYFIKGNHDREETLDYLLENKAIVGWSHYKEINLVDANTNEKYPTVLFHFPITSWHKQSHGSLHLHGHCHGNLKQELIRGKMLDVGLDNAIQAQGEPFFFREQEIINLMLDEEKFVSDLHRKGE